MLVDQGCCGEPGAERHVGLAGVRGRGCNIRRYQHHQGAQADGLPHCRRQAGIQVSLSRYSTDGNIHLNCANYFKYAHN